MTEATAVPIGLSWRRGTVAPLTASVCSLMLADLLALFLAIVFGGWIWGHVNPNVRRFDGSIVVAICYCIVVFGFLGLYPGIGKTAVELLRKIYHGLTLSYLILLATLFLDKESSAYSRGALSTAWILSLIFIPLGRLFVSSRSWWGIPVLILGAGPLAEKVIRSLSANRVLGYRPVMCVDDNRDGLSFCGEIPVSGRLSEVGSLAGELGISVAIVAMPGISRQALIDYLHVWSSVFSHVVIIPDLFGVASLWIEPRDLGGILGVEVRHNLLNPLNRWLKRATDLAGSTLGLVLASPVLALFGLWIRAVSTGPIFYIQEREGRHGRTIRVVKLRTMFVGAEQMLESHLAANAEARLEWSRFCKLRHDPRILPGIGHFLRRTSLDELPQLWNILKGEMSLVGPRPFPRYHNERFTPEFRALRTQVTPGLTGLWQVSSRSDGDLGVQETLDGYYIRNWSLWLDFYLLTRTVRTVISGEGAY